MFRPNQSTPDAVQDKDFFSVLGGGNLMYVTYWGSFALWKSFSEE